MKDVFKPGDSKTMEVTVKPTDVAHFPDEKVHDVYATFALARDAEWACRRFVLEMKEEDEEGIGTMVSIKHMSPAKVGDTVQFTATVNKLEGNEIICSYEARVGNRLIARGEQGQKIIKKEKLKKLFEQL